MVVMGIFFKLPWKLIKKINSSPPPHTPHNNNSGAAVLKM